ncbi:translation initiation factor IF-2-like [Anthonomus grandis grandis]|uniref:translation initiation factor IF-2-like n=1 Tax=Anthonomus grandis grandis TaxID=2921223 RepID=UPI0021662D20|nr:translation initiation factor IF-2-like [Anthonomus grandis grandis]
MFQAVILLSLATLQALASNVAEVLPVAPAPAAVVTSRSSQYFAQNHNALAAPLVAPVQPAVAPVAAAKLEAVAPARLETLTPVAQVVASSGASVSQVTRFAPYFAQYISAPYVAPAPLVTSPVVALPAGRVLANFPVLANPPVAALPAAPVAVAGAQPAQPAPAPAFQPALNPDSESVDIESARLRAAPQQQQQQQQRSQVKVQQFEAQENVARLQQQIRIKGAGQQRQIAQLNAAKGQQGDQQQQQRSAAPGLLTNEEFSPRGYYN